MQCTYKGKERDYLNQLRQSFYHPNCLPFVACFSVNVIKIFKSCKCFFFVVFFFKQILCFLETTKRFCPQAHQLSENLFIVGLCYLPSSLSKQWMLAEICPQAHQLSENLFIVGLCYLPSSLSKQWMLAETKYSPKMYVCFSYLLLGSIGKAL